MLSNFYGSQIKENRQRLKMTVERFAARLGVSRATQMNYESGKTLPTVAYLDECAKIGINPLQLLQAGAAEIERPVDDDGLAAEIFRLIDAPKEPLDTAPGRAWLFEETLRLVRRARSAKG